MVAAATLVAGLAACGGSDETAGDETTGGTTAAVATTSVWADITSRVACDTEVAALIPAGADPHTYEPSLRDRELVSGAAVLIANGAGLEATTHDLIESAVADGVNVVEVATHVDLLVDDGDEHEDGHEDEDEHDDAGEGEHEDDPHGHGEDGDPHIWQDPLRVAGALDVIGSALDAAGLPTCVEAYRDELVALDAEIREVLAPIPPPERLLVTSHDSLAYFADRYDFEVVGSVIPSTSTLADSSAGELADLADLIEQRSVRAIFTDAFESSRDAEALADRLGVAVVPLVTGSLTDESPTYADLLRDNAATIAAALAP